MSGVAAGTRPLACWAGRTTHTHDGDPGVPGGGPLAFQRGTDSDDNNDDAAEDSDGDHPPLCPIAWRPRGTVAFQGRATHAYDGDPGVPEAIFWRSRRVLIQVTSKQHRRRPWRSKGGSLAYQRVLIQMSLKVQWS